MNNNLKKHDIDEIISQIQRKENVKIRWTDKPIPHFRHLDGIIYLPKHNIQKASKLDLLATVYHEVGHAKRATKDMLIFLAIWIVGLFLFAIHVDTVVLSQSVMLKVLSACALVIYVMASIRWLRVIRELKADVFATKKLGTSNYLKAKLLPAQRAYLHRKRCLTLSKYVNRGSRAAVNIRSKFHAAKRCLPHRLAGFRPLGLAFALFVLANLIIFALLSLWPGLLSGLWLSADRPWGIFTSAFVHEDSSHLIGNLGFFLIWSMLFVMINWHHDKETRQTYSKIFLWLIFISGFVTNAIDFIVRWQPSGITEPGARGASGIAYAAAGVCVASTLSNFAEDLRGLFRSGKLKQRLARLGFGASMMILLVLYVTQDPRAFLNVAPEVNVHAHLWGFSLGLLLSLVLFLIYSILKMRKEGFSRSPSHLDYHPAPRQVLNKRFIRKRKIQILVS